MTGLILNIFMNCSRHVNSSLNVSCLLMCAAQFAEKFCVAQMINLYGMWEGHVSPCPTWLQVIHNVKQSWIPVCYVRELFFNDASVFWFEALSAMSAQASRGIGKGYNHTPVRYKAVHAKYECPTSCIRVDHRLDLQLILYDSQFDLDLSIVTENKKSLYDSPRHGVCQSCKINYLRVCGIPCTPNSWI